MYQLTHPNLHYSVIVPTTLSARMQTTNQSPIKCGTRTPALIVSRIVGGSVAKPRDWPWQVALKRTDEDKIFSAGGLSSTKSGW